MSAASAGDSDPIDWDEPVEPDDDAAVAWDCACHKVFVLSFAFPF